ncbi:YigZ family protein [Flavobacterium sp. NRK F7]|uniref:IMPACT family protein n=1 Tax=Flavobacterium sp. NRK F7 TaxID=2954930 RepID=UPI0020915171|nr:YigZ family protein [Flavobacterium sp. NRK F7]MCO6162732.1 YigZ family protein [Flavobacterium sp. NRK F7]
MSLPNTDTYKTIEIPSEEVLFKEKNSKFYGYAFPVTNEEQIKERISELKKQHHAARHWCYAFQIGTENKYYRANDDGEPNNSAGAPIYGQIQSFDVTNILIVVVRYFGGVKLGVGGLISAYKTAAQLALENATIVEKTIDIHFLITFDYKNMNKVMRVIKEHQLQIISQKMEMNCQIEIATRKQNETKITELFESLFEIDCKKISL